MFQYPVESSSNSTKLNGSAAPQFGSGNSGSTMLSFCFCEQQNCKTVQHCRTTEGEAVCRNSANDQDYEYSANVKVKSLTCFGLVKSGHFWHVKCKPFNGNALICQSSFLDVSWCFLMFLVESMFQLGQIGLVCRAGFRIVRSGRRWEEFAVGALLWFKCKTCQAWLSKRFNMFQWLYKRHSAWVRYLRRHWWNIWRHGEDCL